MIGIRWTCIPMTTRNRRRPDFGRPIFAALAIASALCVLAPGCRPSPPAMIPVHGKVTLNGGRWPKPGMIFFCPVKAAKGFPTKPGSAVFGADGVFVAKTSRYEGLIPGEYQIAVRCWEKEPGEEDPGIAYTSMRFTVASESGLELKVPADSGPIVWNQDLPAAEP